MNLDSDKIDLLTNILLFIICMKFEITMFNTCSRLVLNLNFYMYVRIFIYYYNNCENLLNTYYNVIFMYKLMYDKSLIKKKIKHIRISQCQPRLNMSLDLCDVREKGWDTLL